MSSISWVLVVLSWGILSVKASLFGANTAHKSLFLDSCRDMSWCYSCKLFIFVQFFSCVWHGFVSRCCVGWDRFHSVWFASHRRLDGLEVPAEREEAIELGHLYAFALIWSGSRIDFASNSHWIRTSLCLLLDAFENPFALWISIISSYFIQSNLSCPDLFQRILSTSNGASFRRILATFGHAGDAKSFTGPCGPVCCFQQGRFRRQIYDTPFLSRGSTVKNIWQIWQIWHRKDGKRWSPNIHLHPGCGKWTGGLNWLTFRFFQGSRKGAQRCKQHPYVNSMLREFARAFFHISFDQSSQENDVWRCMCFFVLSCMIQSSSTCHSKIVKMYRNVFTYIFTDAFQT